MISDYLRSWLWSVTITLVLSFGTLTPAPAVDKTLLPNVSEALQRMSAGNHTAADRALLFANNDVINAARFNQEITGTAYQTAQSDFAKLNRGFASDAAKHAGADFTVQQSTSQTFSPGTDSDYITIVKDKKQIRRMQTDYNRRVNDYLQNNGVIDQPRSDWQRRLDTDFMADPAHVSEADFRDIAKMNNDAYKRRMSAEYERISRQRGGGKIGSSHVAAYTEEMSEFARKKKGNISEMFKNPSLFNDPKNRAKVIQMMAQEQKYISRIESLDDYLRAQEGLPPRTRTSIAAQGAKRIPSNVKAIKDAHSVAEASRARAIEDLAETMGDVARKNPAFSANIADDITRIIAQSPPAHRAKAIAALRRSNPGLVRTILNRNPNLASADDILRAGDKVGDVARAGDQLSDATKIGRMRKSLGAAAKTLERLGKIAAGVDVVIAANKMRNILDLIERAIDPNTPEDVAQDLFTQIHKMSKELAGSAALIAIMEAHPIVALVYGTWTIGCMAGQWVVANSQTADMVGRGEETCLDRQMSAWDNMFDTYGTKEEKIAQQKALCDKLETAVAEKRIKIKWPYDVSDACNAMKRGEKIVGMLEPHPEADTGTAQLCANIEGQLDAVATLIEKGELSVAQELVDRARGKLTDAGSGVCGDMADRINNQQSTINLKADIEAQKAEVMLGDCQFKEAYPIIRALPDESERKAFTSQWNKALEIEVKARELLDEALTLGNAGDPERALDILQSAAALGPCSKTAEDITDMTDLFKNMTAAEATLEACELKESRKWIAQLPQGPRRTKLVKRWNAAVETERSARKLIKQAISIRNQGDSEGALSKLEAARELTPCDQTMAIIEHNIEQLKANLAADAVADAQAALEACKFKQSRQLIKALPEGQQRAALVKQWNTAYETEKKARDLVTEAMALRDQGKQQRAIGKLHQARILDPCDRTVSAIDKAISQLDTPSNQAMVWKRVATRINPLGYRDDFSEVGRDWEKIDKYSATASGLRFVFKWIDKRSGAVRVKDISFDFNVKNLPETIAAGKPVEFTLEGLEVNHVAKPYAESRVAEIRVKYGDSSIADFQKSLKLGPGSARQGRKPTKKQIIGFTLPGSTPKEFEIHFHIGNTAAYVVWVYRAQAAN